jgi:hypothetical protein
MIISLVDEENVRSVVSAAENSLKECWAKLVLLQTEDISREEFLTALTSFQPTLLAALVRLESFYNELCQAKRDLVSHKAHLKQDEFAKETRKLEKYKGLVNAVIDIGKALGDAFAWLFYQRNRWLLKRHYEHEFIPCLPTRLGGAGEVGFLKNHPMFGRYLVLSHSITTFLRHGDVSLIDPRNLNVAAIGELKTQKVSGTEATTSIFLLGKSALPPDMLPKLSPTPQATLRIKKQLDPKVLARLKRQMQSIENTFKQPRVKIAPNPLGMALACSKLMELFDNSSGTVWGRVMVGHGLMLVGVRRELPSLFDRLTGGISDREEYKRNQDRVALAAHNIVDKTLPGNTVIVGSMPYPTQHRYELELGMRPLFWWPLSTQVREAVIFRRMAVMTLYNPAFLIRGLRNAGLDVESKGAGMIGISKAYGRGHIKLIGVPYIYDLIQKHLFSEETVIAMIKRAVGSVEEAGVQQTSWASINFDFIFE